MALERRLAQAGLDPARIAGWGDVRHTHDAVALAVAEGEADVGFGIAAAADRLGLDFIEVARETYWLALDVARLGADADAILRWLRAPALRRRLDSMPGYAPA